MSMEEYYAQSLALKRIASLNILEVDDLAMMFRVTADRIRHMVSDRIIPHYKRGNRVYFKKSEIEEWQTKHRIPADDEITAKAVTHCATKRLKK